MADFVSFFSRGVEQGSSMVARSQQMKLQQQQLEGVNAIRQLQQQNMMLDMQAKAIEMQQAVQNKEFLVQRNHAFLQAGEMLKQRDLTDPKTDAEIFSLFANVPMATTDPRYKALWDTLGAAKEQAKLQRPPPNAQETEYAAQLRAQAGRPMTEDEKFADFQARSMPATSEQEFFDPTTGNPIMRVTTGKQAGAKGAVTVATQTQLEQKLAAQQSLATGLDELLGSGAEKFFNPADKLKNRWVDKLYAAVDPTSANPERIQAFQKNQTLRAVAIRAITDERGQTSEGDMRRVRQLFPDDDVFQGTPAEAKSLWMGLRESARNNAKRMGEQMGKPALWTYSLDELQTLPKIFPDTVTLEELAKELKRRGAKF